MIFLTTRFKCERAITLIEILVALCALAMLIALIAQLFDCTQKTVEFGNKHRDADAQARLIFDRMSLDFAQMIVRQDVDCFLKDSVKQPGNDQIAFFSSVSGYYPPTGSTSPISLLAYRVNSLKLERMGCGLLLSGQAANTPPMVFLPLLIRDLWPSAVKMDADPDYEIAGQHVFRMEYYYVLKGSGANASALSSVPWDARAPLGHAECAGLRDVAAISVVIALLDPKSRCLVSDDQLNALSGNLADFPENDANGNNASKPGDLEAAWQHAVDACALPKAVASSIRIYRRSFPINSSVVSPP